MRAVCRHLTRLPALGCVADVVRRAEVSRKLHASFLERAWGLVGIHEEQRFWKTSAASLGRVCTGDVSRVQGE